MIFGELQYDEHYSEIHADLVALIQDNFAHVESGLQGDSWIWITEGDEKVAIDSINLEIADGDFITVIGSNGAGKSTLLNLIAGTLLPDQGEIYIDDARVTQQPEHRRASFLGYDSPPALRERPAGFFASGHFLYSRQ